MKVLDLPSRYYRLFRDEDPVGCSEEDFHYVDETLAIPLREAALVLVDCWNAHYCQSWAARADELIETRIVPVVRAARKAGLIVIHAPTSLVAEKYPQSARFFEDADRERAPRFATVDPEWPPGEFVGRSGRYAGFRREYNPTGWKRHYPQLAIAEPLTPTDEDYVVRSGSHLHKVLKRLKVLHLFYAGFATNICLRRRDYGMRAMGERGYNLILLRDCTTAVEAHDTADELLATRVFIQDIETKLAYSTTSSQLIEAFDRA